MLDIKMEVYTPGLELLGLLEVFSAFQYEEKAFTAGTFLVDSPLTEESREMLAAENIIWFSEGVAGIIESIEEQTGQDGDSLLVKGRLLTGILDRRILWGRYDLYGKPAALMHRLVEDCAINPTRGNVEARKIPNLTMAPAPEESGSSIRKQKTGGSLLDTLGALGEANSVAFSVDFDPAALQMQFRTRLGVNRTVNQTVNEPVFFSTELDDVLSSEYNYNSAPYRNVALVAGEGEGADRIFVTVTGDFQNEPVTAVDFLPSGEEVAMHTADGRKFTARAVSVETDPYISAYTGPQIDEAIGKALSGGGGGTTAGVQSFNGRTGAVVPQSGDYTAAMVGAATLAQVNAAIQSAVLDSWEGTY